uniref:Uncharacterized protein n=1 Tax=Romanomermis culicivorax TaxID=13658 RepID=A0A915L508_ROMCU
MAMPSDNTLIPRISQLFFMVWMGPSFIAKFMRRFKIRFAAEDGRGRRHRHIFVRRYYTFFVFFQRRHVVEREAGDGQRFQGGRPATYKRMDAGRNYVPAAGFEAV